MFGVGRRQVLKLRELPTNPSSFVSFRMVPIYLIIVLVVALCSFSLYLSTQILTSSNNDPLQSILPEHTSQSHVANTTRSMGIYDTHDPQLKAAVRKSLDMYLLREGHVDRVQYMIGFRGNDHDSELQLKPRDMNRTYDRDYVESQPVAISSWQPQPESEHPCDAHCVSCSQVHHCDVNGVKFSMENVEVSKSDNVITGSTRLDSLVPVPYFSYWDFGFLTPTNTKNTERNALSAAFISNCGFAKRNAMVRDLESHGVSVDSYGRCEHNKDEDRGSGGQGRERTKIELLSTHKFSLAFENSETDDYVSEKFFGSLVSGSIPVYIGAPNIKFFAPDAGNMDVGGPGKPWKSHAVIYAGDFDFDAKRLADYMLYLDGNDTAYNEYLQWKRDGFSGDFKALVELTSATHTNCRQCILATDWQRYSNGLTAYDEPKQVFDYCNGCTDGKWLFVRERGMYRFTLIRIGANTLEMTVRNILQSIKPKEVNEWKNNQHPDYSRIGPALYAIYHIPTKMAINSDESIQNLPNNVELEVIFV